jgi:hypothetical protein
MPSRVLLISRQSGALHIRLVSKQGAASQPYAALSYCWGSSKQAVTTSSSLNSFLGGIPLESLSQSHQDACLVTEGLGLQYLWIDALCIIQDDDTDKRNQISEMGAVYSNATVVIAASRASTATEGFLGPRFQWRSKDFGSATKTKWLDLNNRGSVLVIPNFSNSFWEPLDERAWALQERLMARRYLEYGTFQTRWFCAKSNVSHPVQDGWKRHWRHKISRDDEGFANVLSAITQLNGSSTAGREISPDLIRKWWSSIITAHSYRSLTYEEDKLLSLAGIAQMFSRLTGDEYTCGFWKCHLLNMLLWKFNKPSPRSYTYIAPSWSWASRNGLVYSHVIEDDELDMCLQLRKVSITLKDPQLPFGAVESGYIDVEGCVGIVEFDSSSDKTQKYSFRDQDLEKWPGLATVSIEFDCGPVGEELVAISDLHLLLINRMHKTYDDETLSKTYYFVNGIVLRYESDCFQRVGRFFTRLEDNTKNYESLLDWFHQFGTQIIRIV